MEQSRGRTRLARPKEPPSRGQERGGSSCQRNRVQCRSQRQTLLGSSGSGRRTNARERDSGSARPRGLRTEVVAWRCKVALLVMTVVVHARRHGRVVCPVDVGGSGVLFEIHRSSLEMTVVWCLRGSFAVHSTSRRAASVGRRISIPEFHSPNLKAVHAVRVYFILHHQVCSNL